MLIRKDLVLQLIAIPDGPTSGRTARSTNWRWKSAAAVSDSASIPSS